MDILFKIVYLNGKIEYRREKEVKDVVKRMNELNDEDDDMWIIPYIKYEEYEKIIIENKNLKEDIRTIKLITERR